jgi:DNA helicase INO80
VMGGSDAPRPGGDLAGPPAGATATASSNANANAHRHSTFSLRSPKQSEFRPPPFSPPNHGHAHSHNTSTSSAGHPHQSPPRQALHNPNPYMSSSSSGAPGGPVAPTLPPPVGLKSSSPAASTPGGLQHHPSQHPSHQQHQHQAPPPVSPLHPPAGYYSPSAPDVHHGRDSKPVSRGFYDPTTDTTKERRVSVSDAATPAASWHNANANANAPPAGTPKVRGANPLLFLSLTLRRLAQA